MFANFCRTVVLLPMQSTAIQQRQWFSNTLASSLSSSSITLHGVASLRDGHRFWTSLSAHSSWVSEARLANVSWVHLTSAEMAKDTESRSQFAPTWTS